MSEQTPLTQKELDYLQDFLDNGDRGGYYIALFNLLEGKDTANGNATYEYTEVNGIEKQVYTEILIDLEEWSTMDGYERGWHSLMHELGHAFGFDDWKLLKTANDNFRAKADFYKIGASWKINGAA